MPDVIDIARISLNDDVRRLQSISQNLSNINTVGYKREIDVSYPALIAGEGLLTPDGGVMQKPVLNATQTVRDFSSGALKPTDNKLDLAILEDGFFEVRGPEGESFYTRKGSFSVDSSGKVVMDKDLVLQGDKGDVQISGTELIVNANGDISDGGSIVNKLTLYSLPVDKSEYMGGGLFKSAAAEKISDENVHIKQGVLESSNVDNTYEMLKMIELSRRFESSAKVLKAYDGLMGDAITTLGNF